MAVLFSYGTLQLAPVQLATFGRELAGRPDTLIGFERVLIDVESHLRLAERAAPHHANAVHTGSTESRLDGTALEVTEDELLAADEYERKSDCARRRVTLESGLRAWIYVSARARE